ncbi:MAG: c-type cytochrome [Methylotenera sp.]
MMLTAIGLNCPMAVIADESNLEYLNKDSTNIKSTDNLARQVHVRSLAASCAACHGTNGNSTGKAAKLAGMDKGKFVTQMHAFKSGERAATVMHRHAKGLNSQEIDDLAVYFSTQTPRQPASLPSQQLSEKYAN